ncbi:tyrosine-type recombinase/integrase [Novispirillum sp. DQ9]|uniref:tyrosine-type recombinase/integrase n=1 Tax=Novispirillum sp. DQ9 TaxID=3398612 RepID=UPI003C7D4E6B
MQGVLSAALVKSLMPADRPYEVRDTRLKGLLLRVQPSGVMTFYVEYARGKRISLGRADAVEVSAARKQAKAVLGDAYHGKDPTGPARSAKEHTFGSFVDEEYAPWARANIRTHVGTLRRLNQSFSQFRKLKLEEVTPLVVERWRADRLAAGAKISTVNRDLDDLKSSIAKAAEWGFISTSPVEKVKRGRTDDRATVRFLTATEEERLMRALDDREERLRKERDSANAWRAERGYAPLPDLRALPYADHLKPMILIALNTGLRFGEQASLTWADIDLERANLTVHGFKAKSRRTRHIPLNRTALSVLSNWHSQRSDGAHLVFPNRHGKPFDNINSSWRAILVAAHITGFRWHDLRHTFASNLVMKGVDLNTVRELLGHSDYQMTLRYAHLAPEHKASAVAQLDR